MYRKIMKYLETWKNNEYRKPLILQGARQVGKTYSILEFGRTHYENVAYFNFETNPKLADIFEENISPDYLIPFTQLHFIKYDQRFFFDDRLACDMRQ